MGTEKLEEKLEEVKIKQTRRKIDPIRFKDEAINKVKKENYVFGKLKEIFIPFIVSKEVRLETKKPKRLSMFNSGLMANPINIK